MKTTYTSIKKLNYPKLMTNGAEYIILALDDTGDCVVINPPSCSPRLKSGDRNIVILDYFKDYDGEVTISN